MDTDGQLMVKKEPWCGVDQQDPENLHIKEEQKEVRTSLEGEQLNLKETDGARFPFTAVSTKSEDDEEKPLLSQLQQQIEDRDVPTSSSADQMTAETSRNPDLNPHEPTPDSSETEVSGDDEEDDDVNLDSEPETRNGDKDLNEGSSELDVKTVNTTFSCPECGKQFLRKSSLQKHLTVTSHSAIRSPGCLVNNKCVGVKQHKDSCRTVQKELKPFKCDFCGKEFSNISNLKCHLRGHTGEKPSACNFCSQRFSNKRALKLHMRVHIEEKPLKCKICKRRFRLKSQLKSHKKIHERQNPNACEICKKIFSQESILKSHMKIHNSQKPVACKKCKKIFCDKSKLKNHMNFHKRQELHVCKICKKRFSHKSKLNRHLKYYQRQNPFSCEVCGQRFAQEELLTSHTSIHTVLKPFGCEHCGQKFRKKSYLTHHASIHTGQKPFACELCGQRFIDKSCLNRHMRVHTGQKPFACELCERRFSQKHHLDNHMRVHTGEKPYACGLCRQRFSCKPSLNNHMRVHTDRILLPVSSVDRDLASRESTQTSSLTTVGLGSKLGELCSDPLKKTVYVKLQPLNTSAEKGKTTDKPTQATREPNKEDNSRGNLNSQTTCAANIPAAPLTRADMEFMLQGLEDQITSKLSAQFTENQALLEQQNSTIQQLETSINNMRNQMLELETTCSILMQENKVLKLKSNDPENGFRRNNICITGLPEKTEGPYSTVFITEFLTEIFGPEAFPMPLVVNVAHRIGVSNPNHEPPRPFMARVHHFQNKEVILKLAQERGRLTYRDTDIHILPYHGPRYPRRGHVPA